MKGLLTRVATIVATTCLAGAVYAQKAPALENLIDDTKNEVSATRGILDYKPRSLSFYFASKVEYDSNVYKSSNSALWEKSGVKKADTISKNTVVADYNFATEEDHAAGLKYVGEFDFYQNNKKKELGMHDMGLFYQYDLDPDPLSARLDFDYKFIRIGEQAFMETKDTEALIKIRYSDLFESTSSVLQKGEYRVKLSYNQYEEGVANIQDETGLDTTLKYKHILMFSKSQFPKVSTYLRSLDLGLEYKKSSPRNDLSKYSELKIRPKARFRNLPFKFTGKIEWIHYDRRYAYRENDSASAHRHDRRDEVKFGIAKRFNKYVSLNLDYMRGRRDSNVATRKYTHNVYDLALSVFF